MGREALLTLAVNLSAATGLSPAVTRQMALEATATMTAGMTPVYIPGGEPPAVPKRSWFYQLLLKIR